MIPDPTLGTSAYRPPPIVPATAPEPAARKTLNAAIKDLYQDLKQKNPVYWTPGPTGQRPSAEIEAEIQEQLRNGILNNIQKSINHCRHPDVSEAQTMTLRSGLSLLLDIISAKTLQTDTYPIYSQALKNPLELIAAGLEIANVEEQAEILQKLAKAMVIFPEIKTLVRLEPFLRKAVCGSLSDTPLEIFKGNRYYGANEVMGRYLCPGNSPKVVLFPDKIKDLAEQIYRHYDETELEMDAHSPGTIYPSIWPDIDGEPIRLLGEMDVSALQSIARRRDHNGQTLLIKIARTGHIGATRALLAAGADVNVTASNTTPLKEAILGGKAKVSEILMDAQADIKWVDQAKKNIYHWFAGSIERISASEVKVILGVLRAYERRSGQPSLINARDSGSRTPLQDLLLTQHPIAHLVSPDVRLSAVMALYECGAQLTPEIFSYLVQNVDLLESLLKSGFSPNKQTKDGRTILTRAVMQRQFDLVKMLLDYGASPTLADHEGNTALRTALQNFQFLLSSIRLKLERQERGGKMRIAELSTEARADFEKHVSQPGLAMFIKPDLDSTSFQSKYSQNEEFLETTGSSQVLAEIPLADYRSIWNRIARYRADLERYCDTLETYFTHVKKIFPGMHFIVAPTNRLFAGFQEYDKIVQAMVEHAERYDMS